MHKYGLKKAFTLMEVMVVIIIISIIAGFGITNYYKSRERAYLKAAVADLRMLARAQKMYMLRNDMYYPQDGDGDQTDIIAINADLQLHLIGVAFTYECKDTSSGISFSCTATRQGGKYSIAVTQALPEPVCSAGTESCP